LAAILLFAVVSSAFHGGLAGGLVSAAVASLYFAIFFSSDGQPFRYAPADLERVLVWGFATSGIAGMVGILKRRLDIASPTDRRSCRHGVPLPMLRAVAPRLINL
jgi:hypothetical protein